MTGTKTAQADGDLVRQTPVTAPACGSVWGLLWEKLSCNGQYQWTSPERSRSKRWADFTPRTSFISLRRTRFKGVWAAWLGTELFLFELLFYIYIIVTVTRMKCLSMKDHLLPPAKKLIKCPSVEVCSQMLKTELLCLRYGTLCICYLEITKLTHKKILPSVLTNVLICIYVAVIESLNCILTHFCIILGTHFLVGGCFWFELCCIYTVWLRTKGSFLRKDLLFSHLFMSSAEKGKSALIITLPSVMRYAGDEVSLVQKALQYPATLF